MTSTVFVSSTFVDLQTHRKSIWEALQNFDVNVRGMEQFGARTETPLQTCIAEVEQSDIYVGVIAFRLGSIEPTSGKSYTQLEYERALALSKEIFIYLIDEQNAKVTKRFIDTGDALEKLDAFKSVLRERHTIDTFVDEVDLVSKIHRDLQRHSKAFFDDRTHEEESQLALSRLRQFALFPKTVAGTEVRLSLRVKGDLYPASRVVCNAFNLEFGATAGVQVEIVEPKDSGHKDPPDLLMPAKLVLEHHLISKGDTIDCYVKLHFSGDRIGNNRARHRDRIDYPESKIDLGYAVSSMLGKPVVSEADSQLAFEASRIIDVAKSAA